MFWSTGVWLTAVTALALGSVGAAWAQAPVPGPATQAPPAESKEEAKPKTFWDEFKLFSYIEMGATFNINGGSKGVPGSTASPWTNTLRYYDINQGYTFDMAEFSIKRDPNEAFPLGGGVVLTWGQDAQKNHSIGLLRDSDDVFPFRNTSWFDPLEVYISGRAPIGNGLVLKLGKFLGLLGYEAIESPLNLNYSRGYLFTFTIPFTTTGGLVSYTFTDWLSAQAGLVLGWDRVNNDNSGPSGTGQIAVTPVKDLSTALNFIVGPEISGNKNPIRWVLDLTANYTGISKLTLGFNFNYSWQANDVFLAAQDLDNKVAQWYGIAAYAAYDFLKDFRVALRQEWFNDVDGVRTGTIGGVTLFSTTATLQYNIWKGLYARGEYRHDNANQPEFDCRPSAPCRQKSQDTLSVSLYYKFF